MKSEVLKQFHTCPSKFLRVGFVSTYYVLNDLKLLVGGGSRGLEGVNSQEPVVSRLRRGPATGPAEQHMVGPRLGT